MPSAPPKMSMPPPPKSTTKPASKGWSTDHPGKLGFAVVLNAVEGWGKTCMGAHLPGASIMVIGESTGYLTLMRSGTVPTIPHQHHTDWKEYMATLDEIMRDPGDMKTLVIDTLTGLEKICFEWICKVRYNGNWGTEDGKGFMAWKQGYATAVPEFTRMLQKLDNIRLKHGIHIVILSHAMNKTHRDPLGPNYDRYVGWCHEKIWGSTKQWCDALLFGTYEAVVEMMKPQDEGSVHAHGKGVGVGRRVLFTSHADAYDAKNRFGLPDRIDVDRGIKDSYKVLDPIFKCEGDRNV